MGNGAEKGPRKRIQDIAFRVITASGMLLGNGSPVEAQTTSVLKPDTSHVSVGEMTSLSQPLTLESEFQRIANPNCEPNRFITLQPSPIRKTLSQEEIKKADEEAGVVSKRSLFPKQTRAASTESKLQSMTLVTTDGSETPQKVIDVFIAKGYLVQQDCKNRLADDTLFPTDERYPEQWSIEKIHAAESIQASDAITTSSAVIFVLDTGLDKNHPEFKDSGLTILEGFNFTRADEVVDSNTDDLHGHGTAVASVIASGIGNGGIVGIRPGTLEVMPLRVLTSKGEGYDSWIAQAAIAAGEYIRSRGDGKMGILNISITGDNPSPLMAKAFEEYPELLSVASAGNKNVNITTNVYAGYPAKYATISACATDEEDEKADFSSWGGNSTNNNSLCAPGEYILMARAGGGYTIGSGTSMGAPIIAGAAALLSSKLDRNQSSRVPIIRDTLFSGAKPMPDGYGNRIDVATSMEAIVSIQKLPQYNPKLIFLPEVHIPSYYSPPVYFANKQ